MLLIYLNFHKFIINKGNILGIYYLVEGYIEIFNKLKKLKIIILYLWLLYNLKLQILIYSFIYLFLKNQD